MENNDAMIIHNEQLQKKNNGKNHLLVGSKSSMYILFSLFLNMDFLLYILNFYKSKNEFVE